MEAVTVTAEAHQLANPAEAAGSEPTGTQAEAPPLSKRAQKRLLKAQKREAVRNCVLHCYYRPTPHIDYRYCTHLTALATYLRAGPPFATSMSRERGAESARIRERGALGARETSLISFS